MAAPVLAGVQTTVVGVEEPCAGPTVISSRVAEAQVAA
jgi:hypothetical protein